MVNCWSFTRTTLSKISGCTFPPHPQGHTLPLLVCFEASGASPAPQQEQLTMAEVAVCRRIKTGTEVGARPDGAAAEEGRPDGEIAIKISSEALLCRICLEPLKPPIFKCEAGHVLCSPCLEKLRLDGHALKLEIFCDLCCKTTSYRRCVELELFINAIKVPCSNQTYGCNESVRYHEKEKHESQCTHAPCHCPETDCTFRGAVCCLLEHFITAHGWSPTNFSYNKPLKVSIPHDHRFTLLVGEDQSIFLLTNTLAGIGNALSMVCVRPCESGPNYSCNISAANSVVGGKAEGRLVFQKDPLVSSSSLSGGVQLGKFFLLVPPELADNPSGELTVHIRVDRLAA
ncbi:E3 ubiquitin-protein ligase SINA-like 10 [Lolium rigidum]|uniref:E3 ubiquitin-protein ligase SINA-like 10 n=1 Tax=Lolium rigidum TaxID=89674 RepID=UPI001F5DC0B6|nr:E3 ubiquitin-protein ligase SINA-like 10 [Lolium rigidum]